MTCVVDEERASRPAAEETAHEAAGDIAPLLPARGCAGPDLIARSATSVESSRRAALRLALSFALLIAIMVGLGWWISWRIMEADAHLEANLSSRTVKLQLIYEALGYSNENSRIAMNMLLAGRTLPEPLHQRAANRQKISELIARLEQQCDSDRERELLRKVTTRRSIYVEDYQRALQLVLDDRKAEQAKMVMLSEATPALFSYHGAWEELAGFELQQMQTAAQRATEHDMTTRHIGLALQWLAAILAGTIAVFNTRRIARDMELRNRMQFEVSQLNAQLERRVEERTEELARRDEQLRESLAESREYAADIEAVNELAQLLQTCLTLDEAKQQVSRVLSRFFADGAMLLLNPSRNLLNVSLVWGATSTRQGPFPPESCWALRRGQAHRAALASPNPMCSHYHTSETGCYLCIPMLAQGQPLGIISLEDSGICGRDSTPHDHERKLKLANTMAEQISLAFANLTLRETLKYQSVRDPLTGLSNRRHMEEGLERELQRAARKSTSVAVMMIDIDHFKDFNDTFGHEAGDVVLREFGVLLKLLIRGGDLACRYGGEEFLLVMGETDLQSACQRAEVLRGRVASLPVRYHGQTLRSITISIGVAIFPAHGSSAEQLVNAADGALYRAKREGRDRMVVAE